MNLRRGSSLVLISLAFGASILSGVAATGVLDGGFSTLPPGANVQLSAEGTLDWVQWGLTGPDDVNRKAGVTPLISGITVIGEELVQWFDDNATGYTWTDGDPTPEADNATTGIYLVGAGQWV